MRDRRTIIPLLFGLWTLFVWGGRLRNLSSDPGGFAEASRWSLVGSVLFTVLGLAVVAAVVAGQLGQRSVAVLKTTSIAALGTLTVGVWLVRAVDITLGDHAVGFIAVHVILALISVTLAFLSIQVIRSQVTAGSQSGRSEPGRSPVG